MTLTISAYDLSVVVTLGLLTFSAIRNHLRIEALTKATARMAANMLAAVTSGASGEGMFSRGSRDASSEHPLIRLFSEHKLMRKFVDTEGKGILDARKIDLYLGDDRDGEPYSDRKNSFSPTSVAFRLLQVAISRKELTSDDPLYKQLEMLQSMMSRNTEDGD